MCVRACAQEGRGRMQPSKGTFLLCTLAQPLQANVRLQLRLKYE